MKELPFVSVIVPTYNRASLLKRLLESLREQTYPADKFEVLVVDDGSTDETPQVVEEFARSAPFAVRYFRQPRKGPAAARNLGIQQSRGEIVAFVDSDVTVAKDWLTNAVHYFLTDKVDGVEGRTEPCGTETPFAHRAHNLKGGQFLTCNIFYTRAILKRIGGFDERFRAPHREDSDLAWRVLDAGGRIVFAPDVVAFHPYFPKRPLTTLKSSRCFNTTICSILNIQSVFVTQGGFRNYTIIFFIALWWLSLWLLLQQKVIPLLLSQVSYF
jgi:glycosyltransferase involved in cell wall biosynthesis